MEYSIGSISKLISSSKQNDLKKAKKRKAEKIPEEIVEEKKAKPGKEQKKSKKEKKQKVVEPVEETNDSEVDNDEKSMSDEEPVEEKKIKPDKKQKKSKKGKKQKIVEPEPEEENEVENKDSDEESDSPEIPDVSFTIEKEGGLSDEDDELLTDEEDASESEDDEMNGKQENGESKKPLTEEEKEEERSKYNDRTVFVGNLPLTVEKKKLKKLFEKFGVVESVRLRGAPTSDPRVPKKIAMIKKQFHKDRNSFHGYVRFAEREDALKSVEMNGHDFNGHHLRVNICDATEKPDQNKAIFLGNVSFDAEEEELWSLFESCGEIESVRLVRDRKTNVGKGFGYVNFKSSDAVELALQMGEVVLRKRQLRVSACDTKKPKKKFNDKKMKDKDSKPSFRGKKFEKKNNDADGNSFHGKQVTDKKKKKFNKSTQQKKKLVKKIAPKVKA